MFVIRDRVMIEDTYVHKWGHKIYLKWKLRDGGNQGYVYLKKKNERKGMVGNENNRQGKRKKGRSFPECFLPRMTFILNFFRSEGAHRESGLERLAWVRNIARQARHLWIHRWRWMLTAGITEWPLIDQRSTIMMTGIVVSRDFRRRWSVIRPDKFHHILLNSAFPTGNKRCRMTRFLCHS